METFTYDNIPESVCFTFDKAIKVYYMDSSKDEPKHFHSYKDGYLFEVSTKLYSKNERFYACDINGRYIPVSIILENRELKKRIKELEAKPYFISSLKVGI